MHRFQIGSNCGKKDRVQVFNCLQFQYNLPFDDHVQSMQSHWFVIVINRYRNLTIDFQTTFIELDPQSFFVNRLKKARAQATMDFNRRPNDPLGQFFKL